MRRRFLLIGLTALAGALAGPSCLSPTLPLPPPDVESVSQSADDPALWSVAGTCAPGALVIVFNDETGQGAVFEDRTLSGKWFVQLEAERCDRAWTSQERGNDSSTRAPFIIDTITAGAPDDSGLCQ